MMGIMPSDDPITIPPPEGEEDAYSAATRVGSIPADLVAKFREQGLLPASEPALPAAEDSAGPATEQVVTEAVETTAAAASGRVETATKDESPTEGEASSAAAASTPAAAASTSVAAASTPAAAPTPAATPTLVAAATSPDRSWMWTAPVALAGGAVLVIFGTLAFLVALWARG